LNIATRQEELGMSASASLGRSTLRPDNRLIRETNHILLAQRKFRLHHVFLECCTASK
jgi:hypothetical protein